MAGQGAADGPGVVVVHQWILDTRPLWPEAEKTAQLERVASRALALLAPAERAAVLRYYFVRDAKMALGSHLLKRLAVSRLAGVPWRSVAITRNARTKPVFVAPDGAEPVAFNVSHQAGLVAVAAVAGYRRRGGGGGGGVDVGVDVVCPGERRARDRQMVREDGWPAFVDVHADVLGASEVAYLKHQMPGDAAGPGPGPDEAADSRLRCFYALWCLREAYVKMTGDALLAAWLKDLEFRNFRPPPPPPPPPTPGPAGDGEDHEASGQQPAVTQHEIWFKGERRQDVNACLRSVGAEYMVCTMVQTPEEPADGLGMKLGPFEMLDIEEVLAFAESRLEEAAEAAA